MPAWWLKNMLSSAAESDSLLWCCDDDLWMQVVIDGTDGADPYDVIDVGAGSAIRNDMELDEEEENVYVLSGKKVRTDGVLLIPE